MDNILTERNERQTKIYAVIATIVMHVLLFLLFIFVAFTIPNPPFPDGGSPGVELSFGNGDVGSGSVYESNNAGDHQPADNQKKSVVTPVVPDDNSVVTNEAEETVILKSNKKPKKSDPKKHVIEKKDIVEEKVKEPQPDNELAEAMKALKASKGISGGHGDDGKPGGVGDPNGTPGPLGSGGNGTEGNGPGGGDPTDKKKRNYVLTGRNMVKRPHIMDDSQEEGIVVVEILVDETGKVLKATPGARGTTTSNSVLWSKARQAALTDTRFSPHPKGEKEQKGTITFVFLHN